MNRLSWLVCFTLGCSPAGVPTLELSTAQSSLQRGATTRVRAVARAATGDIGRGTVRFESDVGSLVTPQSAELDAFGSAEVDFTCDGPDCAAAQRATLTGRWLVNSVAISNSASLRLTGGGAGGGSASGGGTAGGAAWASYGNALSLTGADGGFIFKGSALITDGTITTRIEDPSYVSLSVTPASSVPGDSWHLQFAVPQGQPFGVGTYTMAQRAGFREPGRSGLALTGFGRACNTVAGSFEVIDFSVRDGGIAATTITFEQLCEQQPGNWVRGWIRYGH